MLTINNSIHINAPVEKVFAYVTSIANSKALSAPRATRHNA